MDFEWDDNKATANYDKHGIAFEEAKTVFDDPLFLDFYDPDHSWEEDRYIILGRSRDNNLLMVAYTERGGRTRIISARPTTPKERRAYEGYKTSS